MLLVIVDNKSVGCSSYMQCFFFSVIISHNYVLVFCLPQGLKMRDLSSGCEVGPAKPWYGGYSTRAISKPVHGQFSGEASFWFPRQSYEKVKGNDSFPTDTGGSCGKAGCWGKRLWFAPTPTNTEMSITFVVWPLMKWIFPKNCVPLQIFTIILSLTSVPLHRVH